MGMESAWAFGYSPARPAGMYPGSAFGMLGGNGSAAFADIGSGTAVLHNRCSTGDFTAAARVDHLVIDAPDQQGRAGEEALVFRVTRARSSPSAREPSLIPATGSLPRRRALVPDRDRRPTNLLAELTPARSSLRRASDVLTYRTG
jgi:hypothetical protein